MMTTYYLVLTGIPANGGRDERIGSQQQICCGQIQPVDDLRKRAALEL
jgi:hypothetical protein